MDLVDDHQAGQITQRIHRSGQAREVVGILQVEDMHGLPRLSSHQAGERRLPHLSGADQRNDGAGTQLIPDRLGEEGPQNHQAQVCRDNRANRDRFSSLTR